MEKEGEETGLEQDAQTASLELPYKIPNAYDQHHLVGLTGVLSCFTVLRRLVRSPSGQEKGVVSIQVRGSGTVHVPTW